MGDIDATTTAAATTPSDKFALEGEKLPKLNARDFRTYNHMAEHMDLYHNHFRSTWNMLYSAASSNKRPQGMSMRQFLAAASDFCTQLTFHHTYEERNIFPILARKMPAFREELELLTHHKKIHEGLELLEEYVREARLGETELRMGELKKRMDGFGAVLWEHLDAEVAQLGAENMRRYWTLEEMGRMPM